MFSALSPEVVAIEGLVIAKLPAEEAMFINRMIVESMVYTNPRIKQLRAVG